MPNQNMNTKCFCGHPLSSHSAAGVCGVCNCIKFTERLTYKCDVCGELLSILTAPNDQVCRVRFKDDGRNYAHTKCLREKPKPKGPFKRPENVPSTWIKKVVIPRDEAVAILGVLYRLGVFTPDEELDDEMVESPEEREALYKFNAIASE